MAEKTFTGPAWLERASGWLKGHERQVLYAAAGFHLLVLLLMIVIHSLPLWLGETVLLQVQPLDPRDWFRGDFVILNYDINRIGPDRVEGLREDYGMADDHPVYVTLEKAPDGKHWRAGKASIHRPASGKYIRGKYTRGMLRFGIEAYYVQEGTGPRYEQASREGRLSAEVALTSWGQATLQGLRIEEPGKGRP
jgi:uncharacterized membrane-anchored protein